MRRDGLAFLLLCSFVSGDDICFSDSEWGPPMIRGVGVDVQSDLDKLAHSLARHTCNGGNWVSIRVACPQKNLNDASTLSCPNVARDLAEAIDVARCVNNDIGVFLSPFPSYNDATSWQAMIGEAKINDELFWKAWFSRWGSEMQKFANMAQDNRVNLLGIGLELNIPQTKTSYWKDLIAKQIRPNFQGFVVYGADKRTEGEVQFWNSVDYIGVDAYYGLARNETEPSLSDLQSSWGKHVKALEKVAKSNERTIIFTEIGYRSLYATNTCPACWVTKGAASNDAQANLYEALFRSVCTKSWFAGLFIHGWEVDVNKAQNPTGYELIGKPAEDVLAKWFRAKDVEKCRADAEERSRTCVTRVRAKHAAAVLAQQSLPTTNGVDQANALILDKIESINIPAQNVAGDKKTDRPASLVPA